MLIVETTNMDLRSRFVDTAVGADLFSAGETFARYLKTLQVTNV